MVGLVLFIIWMLSWVLLCWGFYYMDKDYFYTRNILPNLPLEIASEEDIMEMVEEKLEEKKIKKKAAVTSGNKQHTKLYQFTVKQLLSELAFRMKQR